MNTKLAVFFKKIHESIYTKYYVFNTFDTITMNFTIIFCSV